MFGWLVGWFIAGDQTQGFMYRLVPYCYVAASQLSISFETGLHYASKLVPVSPFSCYITIFTHYGVELNLTHTRPSLYQWTAFQTWCFWGVFISHSSLWCIPQLSPHIHLAALLPWLPSLFKLGFHCQRGCYTLYGMIWFHHLGKIQTLTVAWWYMRQIVSIYFKPLLLSMGSIPHCHMEARTVWPSGGESREKSEACFLALPNKSSFFSARLQLLFSKE